jgi:hypothetical protein
LTNIPSGWSRNTTLQVNACSWAGLACNPSGRLTKFVLNGVAQGTSIPSAIGSFPALEYLSVLGSNFVGSIPAQIFLPQNLSYVDLGSNFFTGSVPAAANGAVNLATLRLGFNALTGTNFRLTLFLLFNLINFHIFPLSGVLPSGLDALTKIRSLDIGRNRFECPFPVAMYNRLKQSNETRDWYVLFAAAAAVLRISLTNLAVFL